MRNARGGRTVARILDVTAHPISLVRWRVEVLGLAGGIGLGMLAGPAVYVVLALVT